MSETNKYYRSGDSVISECKNCLAKEDCRSKRLDGIVRLIRPTELEVKDTSGKIVRLMVGTCTNINRLAFHSMAHIPEHADQDHTVGVHGIRLHGFPTVTMDMEEMQPAPSAPIEITDLIDTIIEFSDTQRSMPPPSTSSSS